MPTEFPPNTKPAIHGVQLLELRAQLGGARPMVFLRHAFLEKGGQAMAQVITNYMSTQSRELLEALVASLEVDFVEYSSTELEDRAALEEAALDDGLTYPSP